MLPTTVWATIHKAGESDRDALERVARAYRPPVLHFIRSRGFTLDDAEDVCQDVFVRLLAGGVLARADASRGRFRSFLLAVTIHTIQDRLRRKRREHPIEDLEPADRDPDFDRAWVLHLAEVAMARLKGEGSPYYRVLQGHLAGRKQDRKKLWIARRKLIAFIRDEIAQTCSSHEEFEAEVRYLSRYLRPTPPERSSD